MYPMHTFRGNVVDMKRLLLFAFGLLPLVGVGQNFSTVVPDTVHYFQSEMGTLVGLRVDSTFQTNDTTEFYFHREFRFRHHASTVGCDSVPSSSDMIPTDTYGPSWLGLKCVRYPDSTEVYFNYVSDSIFIRPTATVGETWTVFREGDGSSIQAQMVNVVTDTLAGQPQSVKVMELQQLDSLGQTTTGVWNGVQWQLSQYSGWAEVHSLYMFPSFDPEDYFLPEGDWGILKTVEMRDSTRFALYQEPIPTMGEMFDYPLNAHYQMHGTSFVNNGGFFETDDSYDHYYILVRQNYNDSIRYVINGNEWMLYQKQKRFPNNYLPFQCYGGPQFGQMTYSEIGLMIVGQPVQESMYSTDVIIDCQLIGWSMTILPGLEPLAWGDSICVYYPDCSPMSIEFYNHLPGYTYGYGCFESSSSNVVNYAQMDLCSFGHILYEEVNEMNAGILTLYPNPATTTLRIQLPEYVRQATGIRIFDMMGRQVQQQAYSSTIDVSSLAKGTYVVVVTTEQGKFRNVIRKE